MGRGKKNKGKEEPPSLSSLSISEAPSTSTQPSEPVREQKSAEPEPEEDGGLGLGGGKKRPRKKKKEATPEATKLQEAAPTQTVPVASVVPKEHLSQPPVLEPSRSQQASQQLPWGKKVPQTGPTIQPTQSSSTTPFPSPTHPAPVSVTAQRYPEPTPVTSVPPPSSSSQAYPSSVPVTSDSSSGDQGAGRGAPWAGRGRGRGGRGGAGAGRGEDRGRAGAGRGADRSSAEAGRGYTQQDVAQAPPPARKPTESTQPSAPVTGAVSRFRVPRRIDGNSVKARNIKVLTNYLCMEFRDLKINRYDVSFKPELKKWIPKAFQLAKAKHFPKQLTAFDQMKNCYTIEPLRDVPGQERFVTQVEVQDNNGRLIKFEVSFKHTGIVCLDRIRHYMNSGETSLNAPTEAIQCVDIILRQGTLESYVKAGKQFFKRPTRPIDLSGGLEMWTGLFQSAIFTSRAFINIDVAHKGFPRQQWMIEALTKDFRLDPTKPLEDQPQNRYNIEMFKNFLKGLRVVANVGGNTSASGQKREFICNGVVNSARALSFTYEDPATKKKEQLTVADFFAKVKGCRLRYPNLNCLWVGPRDKTIYYPMELLEVSYGQALNKQLNENQLRTMVMQAATPPDDRKYKIEEVIKDMNYSNNAFFKSFGLDISNEFYQVDARVLMPPRLEVGPNTKVVPSRGEWRARGVLKPQSLVSWCMIAVDVAPNSLDFENIVQTIINTGRGMGMSMSSPTLPPRNVNMRELEDIFKIAQQKAIKFLFVIVGTRNRDLYHKVKQLAERKVGILTQCIKEYTAAKKMNGQTVQNILLKVNSKLMGVNQTIDDSSTPRCLANGDVMVVGADVTHPSPDQSSIPSIAAVTASIDPKCYMYNIELSIQTPKKEMIVQFEDMMVDHLRVYKERQKALPKKIFVFRDGVSEGQFAEVMRNELQAVHNAYQRMTGNPSIKPEVLFLLVQKRHHTRLFLPNSKYNVEPGTVVDKDIVHASELDFYLVSHQAIKGTARPTRYHAVCNDGGIKHDEVEQLTFYLCHLFSRCTRSVSYPTPTYYAHLACLRARSLTFGETFDNEALEKNPKRLRVMDNILQLSRMFFV